MPSACDALARSLLETALLDTFHSCAPADRAHQCRVALALRDRGIDDPVVLAAALLHDVGKASTTHSPTLIDRAALVVLGRVSPSLCERLAAATAGGCFGGFAVAARHAEIGADRLRRLGAGPYLVWLVRHHHRDDIRDDPALALLQAADRSAP